jgi:hypothetical protein
MRPAQYRHDGSFAAQLSKRSGSDDVSRPLGLEPTAYADQSSLDESIPYAA